MVGAGVSYRSRRGGLLNNRLRRIHVWHVVVRVDMSSGEVRPPQTHGHGGGPPRPCHAPLGPAAFAAEFSGAAKYLLTTISGWITLHGMNGGGVSKATWAGDKALFTTAIRPRRRQRVATAGLGLVLAAALARLAHAAVVLDQSHVLTQSYGGLITVTDFTPAQTFTAGKTGLLSKVDVQIYRESTATGDLGLEIWSTAGGAPSGAGPLFSTTIPNASVPVVPNGPNAPFTSVSVGAGGIQVTPGQTLAVALRRTASFDDPTMAWIWGPPAYAGGDPYSTAFGRPWEMEADDIDFGFKTWVQEPSYGPPGPDYRVLQTAKPVTPTGGALEWPAGEQQSVFGRELRGRAANARSSRGRQLHWRNRRASVWRHRKDQRH